MLQKVFYLRIKKGLSACDVKMIGGVRLKIFYPFIPGQLSKERMLAPESLKVITDKSSVCPSDDICDVIITIGTTLITNPSRYKYNLVHLFILYTCRATGEGREETYSSRAPQIYLISYFKLNVTA